MSPVVEGIKNNGKIRLTFPHPTQTILTVKREWKGAGTVLTSLLNFLALIDGILLESTYPLG